MPRKREPHPADGHSCVSPIPTPLRRRFQASRPPEMFGGMLRPSKNSGTRRMDLLAWYRAPFHPIPAETSTHAIFRGEFSPVLGSPLSWVRCQFQPPAGERRLPAMPNHSAVSRPVYVVPPKNSEFLSSFVRICDPRSKSLSNPPRRQARRHPEKSSSKNPCCHRRQLEFFALPRMTFQCRERLHSLRARERTVEIGPAISSRFRLAVSWPNYNRGG